MIPVGLRNALIRWRGSLRAPQPGRQDTTSGRVLRAVRLQPQARHQTLAQHTAPTDRPLTQRRPAPLRSHWGGCGTDLATVPNNLRQTLGRGTRRCGCALSQTLQPPLAHTNASCSAKSVRPLWIGCWSCIGPRHGGDSRAPNPVVCLRTQVPIQGEVWQQHRVGFLEADSVAHCGDSLAGDFVWSLTYTDMASTWTEGRAVWNKGAAGVLAQTRDCRDQSAICLAGIRLRQRLANGSIGI